MSLEPNTMLRGIDTLGPLDGKRVIVRCDLNVPLDGSTITDDGRIRASLPTLTALLDSGASVIVIAHLGRPDGTPQSEFSLAPVAARLGELMGRDVHFATDTVGDSARETVSRLDSGVAVLENLRFDPRETSKNASERESLARELAAFADAYVSDGFGVVHRAHASVYELAQLLPSAAGSLIQTELEVLQRLTDNPQRPFTVVLGGSKVSDKLGVIDKLLPHVDNLLIGGGMAFTFLAAQGHTVGASLLEMEQLDAVRGYLDQAARTGVNLVVPSDVVVASAFAADAEHTVRAASSLEDTPWHTRGLGLDIGPDTASQFSDIIRASATVFWNGPMGVFEFPPFSRGTATVAAALADTSGFTVVGGGDSAAAVRQLGFDDDRFDHISTGGGASLEFLEGKRLPGLEVLGWQ